MKEQEKYLQYAALITGAISSMFEEESEWYVSEDEFLNDDNLTDFIHALSNVVPAHLYNNLTGDRKNHLEFNHLANQLCFQYMKNNKK